MTDEQALAYVTNVAQALALPLTTERAQRVAQNLARNAQIAGVLDNVALEAYAELAEIYCPAPFPSADRGATRHG
jgi:hypothetical protein